MNVNDLPNPRLLSLNNAVSRREALRAEGKRVVLTNGCFDLLHTGHVYFLSEAAKLGDALFIAINSDVSVKALKGETRPVQSELERAYLLGRLDFVDTLVTFGTPRLTAEIEALKPDVYAKAGDYTLETLNAEERGALEACGADIQFMPFLQGYSTTSLIAKISAAAKTF
ncbi:adenylyltransferase/cytidyltransferase family protein [Cerasicoccus maritimus]|uniref:adenylyltransferase/cytidyltransferase family protein n=1 Tax=Cerasicoccus maritimus TaxID=490089 RepID=UPI00285280AF|nr:adenylyltransferase/cytidyltransferase family protein [Cerasicoccus maritimus]